jgi:hypothetical protein
MSTTPTDKDRQINPHPTVSRMSEGKFYVSDLVIRPWAGPNWNHPLFTECEHCHRQLEINLRAPLNVPQFVKDEACRIVIIEHLRTEHHSKRQAPPNTAMDSN